MSLKKSLLVFFAAFVTDFLTELYFFALPHRIVWIALPLAVVFPWVNTYLAVILIDAKTSKERFQVAFIYSLAMGLSTGIILLITSP